MSNFPVIFSQEFHQTVKSKAFRTITIIFVIFLLVLAGAVFLLSSDGSADYGAASLPESSGLYIVDETADGAGTKLCAALGANSLEPADVKTYETLVSSGDMELIVAVRNEGDGYHFDTYERASLYGGSGVSADVYDILRGMTTQNNLTAMGLSEEDARNALNNGTITFEEHYAGKFAFSTYIVSYLLIILMFMCITLYGQLVATNVATEKSSRTMEILITSASPVELLTGKVLGTCAAAMLQLLGLLAGGAVIGVAAAKLSPGIAMMLSTMFGMSAFDVVCILLFFALGFLLVAFVYGALGSLVSQLEDLSAVINIPTVFFVVGYFIAIMMSSNGEVSSLSRICSFVPFWSPMVMTVRMSMENVPAAQVLLSLGLQALACVVFALLGAKLYRMGTLMYGKAPTPKEIVKLLRTK